MPPNERSIGRCHNRLGVRERSGPAAGRESLQPLPHCATGCSMAGSPEIDSSGVDGACDIIPTLAQCRSHFERMRGCSGKSSSQGWLVRRACGALHLVESSRAGTPFLVWAWWGWFWDDKCPCLERRRSRRMRKGGHQSRSGGSHSERRVPAGSFVFPASSIPWSLLLRRGYGPSSRFGPFSLPCASRWS